VVGALATSVGSEPKMAVWPAFTRSHTEPSAEPFAEPAEDESE
jgi:hypothetical protein